ncbi:hypothetical protein R1sor_005153 [Riccia sorocarpa]|uniref:FCP1 homology domain-containing protein n=1 Tax=Riccia sorocarpa TaxID=122646 RepID=A0ABD3HIZ8_9MARC
MIHQDRWRDFALLGVAAFAERHHPLPEVDDAMKGTGGKDDQVVYDINTYRPTVCHSYDIEHACTELCQNLGLHICAVSSNDGTADGRYVSHVIFPLPKAVQEKLRLAELEGVKLDAVSGGEAPESSQRSGVDLIQLTEKERSSYDKRETLGVFSRKREHQVADLLVEVETEVRQTARVYVQYLMKIFRGTSTCIPRWGDAEGFVADKFEKMQSRLQALEDTETRLLNDIHIILPLHREFVELNDLFNDMQAQLSSVQSAVRERREEEECLKVQVFKMETYMRKVKEDPIGLSVRVLELRAERARLEEWLREQTRAKQDLEKALRMQRPPLLSRRKTIIIDLNGLLMKVGRSKEELAAAARNGYDILSTAYAKTWFIPRPGLGGFLRRCMEWFNVIFWTSRQDRNMAVLLKKCDQMGFFPSELKKKASIPKLNVAVQQT